MPASTPHSRGYLAHASKKIHVHGIACSAKTRCVCKRLRSFAGSSFTATPSSRASLDYVASPANAPGKSSGPLTKTEAVEEPLWKRVKPTKTLKRATPLLTTPSPSEGALVPAKEAPEPALSASGASGSGEVTCKVEGKGKGTGSSLVLAKSPSPVLTTAAKEDRFCLQFC